jgi:hypothetical protein
LFAVFYCKLVALLAKFAGLAAFFIEVGDGQEFCNGFQGFAEFAFA